jgi:hypothetical protein
MLWAVPTHADAQRVTPMTKRELLARIADEMDAMRHQLDTLSRDECPAFVARTKVLTEALFLLMSGDDNASASFVETMLATSRWTPAARLASSDASS